MTSQFRHFQNREKNTLSLLASLVGSEPRVGTRSHHPEVQRELSHQVELLGSSCTRNVSELLEYSSRVMNAALAVESRPKFQVLSKA